MRSGDLEREKACAGFLHGDGRVLPTLSHFLNDRLGASDSHIRGKSPERRCMIAQWA